MSSSRTLVIGNSDGIGAVVVELLVAKGHRVIGVSKSASRFAHSAFRHEVHDVTAPSYVELLGRLVIEEGMFDACIYCAGIGSALELPDLSREAHVIDVNLTAMVRTVAALAPQWLREGRGHFVGLSSLSDVLYNADAPSYSASKAGFTNYLLSIERPFRRSGVAVTNVRLGFVDTKLARAAVRPLMMTPLAAAEHVVRVLETRPAQVSVPKATALAAWTIGCAQAIRSWIV
jgi:short-subunit dehydrogenase